MPTPAVGLLHRELHLEPVRLQPRAAPLHRALHLLHPREQARPAPLHRELHLEPVRLPYNPRITGTFHIFDDVDYTTDLGTLTHVQAASWLDADDDVGSGSVTLQDDDAQLPLLASDRVVQCRVLGEPAFSWVIDGDDHRRLLPAGESEHRTTKRGKGTASILNRATMFPTLGFGSQPFSDDRVFSFAAPQYPIGAGWVPATVIFDSALLQSMPPGFPTVAPRLGPSSGNTDHAPIGHWYLIHDFTLTADSFVTFFMGVDNGLVAAVDGIKLLDLTTGDPTQGITHVQTATMFLTAGAHRFAADVINYDFNSITDPGPGAGPDYFGNPTFFQCAAWSVTGQGEMLQHLFNADSTWYALEYPDAPPGMTMGRIWNIVLDEVAADGLLTTLARDWTDDLDANGNPFDVLPSVAAKVGMDLEAVLKAHQGSSYLDFAMAPDSNTLRLYRWQERGVPTATVYAAGVNIAELTEKVDDTRTDCFSVRWSKGQLRWPASGGDRMGYLTLPAATMAEAETIAEAVRQSQMVARTQLTFGPVPRGDGDVPYRDFRPADTIELAALDERVRQIGATTDDTLGLKFGVTVRDVVLDADERLNLILKRFANGNLGGKVYAAAPAIAPPNLLTGAQASDVSFNAPEVDGVPVPSESADKTLAVGANLYGVKVTLKTAPDSTTRIQFKVDGVDILAGTGVISGLGPVGNGVWIFTVVTPSPVIYCTAHVTRLAAVLVAVGGPTCSTPAGATGILIEPLFV